MRYFGLILSIANLVLVAIILLSGTPISWVGAAGMAVWIVTNEASLFLERRHD